MKTFLLGGALLAVGFGAFAACTWGDYNGVLPPYDAGPEGSAPTCNSGGGCGPSSFCVNGFCLISCNNGSGDDACPPGQRCLGEQTDNSGPQLVCVTHDQARCCPSGCQPCSNGANGNSVTCAGDGECRQNCTYNPGGGPQQQGSCPNGETCQPSANPGCPTCMTGLCYGSPAHDAPPDAGSWPSTVIQPGSSGQVTSDDGLFTAAFPQGSLNTTARVSISRNLDAGGLPSFCTAAPVVSCWSSAYTVTLVAEPSGGPTAQLTHPIALTFNLSGSGFGVPQTETFMVKPGPQAMPGVWTPNGNVDGLQAADSASSTLGPYAIVHAGPAVSSTMVCGGNDVCNGCAHGCCSGASSPAPSAGIHEACICTGQSPSTDLCLGNCLTMNSETCP